MNISNRTWLWLIGLAFVGAVIYYFSEIVAFVLVAWVLSMLGRPVMVFFLRRFRIGRFRIGSAGAAVLTILTFYAAVIGVLLIFVPTIVQQARNLASVDYQALGAKLQTPFSNFDHQLHQTGLLSHNESLAGKTQELLSNWFKPALLGDYVGTFLGAAGSMALLLSSVTFILFFFLKDNNLFVEILHALVPNEMEHEVRHAVQESSIVLTRYFSGLVTQLFIFAVLVTSGLWMFGIDNALLIGAFGGIFNVIPYIGPTIGIVFGCFITVSSHLDLEFYQLIPMLLKLVSVFYVVQVTDNSLLGPIIFSKSVKAHPLEIFIVTLIAAKLGGVPGMILGIPVYTVLRVIARIFFSQVKIVQRLTEHLDE